MLSARQTEGNVPPTRTLTGSGGEFQFSGLPAGVYLLRAERDGYASYRHGEGVENGPGTPIVLGADDEFSTQIRLRKLGVVTGRVTDENQVGLEDLPVHAYRQGETWQAVATTTTDDRGVYRLSGLKPGRYVIRTAARSLADGVGLLPTYYAQAARLGQARVLEVPLDQEVTGVDISPAPGRLGALSGRLVGAWAREVVLLSEVGPRRAQVKPGGTFDFGPTEPGEYQLVVDPRSPDGSNLAAWREIVMGTSDLEVGLELGTAPRISITCAPAANAEIDTRLVSIFLRRAESGGTPLRLGCGESTIWSPGNVHVAVATPLNYYPAAILEGERGAVHSLRLLPGEDQQLTVLLGDRPGLVTGTVRADDDLAIGAPVFLTTQDEELRSRLGGIRSERTDTEGRFRFGGLPPGRYEVLSSYDLQNPEPDEIPAGFGTAVRVREAEEVDLDLGLTSIR